MAELTFECIDSHPDRYAAIAHLVFRLRITETSGEVVHAIGLRVQFRIEPHRRRYSEVESVLLADLFGETSRWGDTLKPMQFATIAVMVPGFSGSTEIDVPVPCTYDLEVAAGKYFAKLEDGEIPMILLFSGTVFVKGPSGFAVDQVSWASETRHRLAGGRVAGADGPLLPRLGLDAPAPGDAAGAAELQGRPVTRHLGRSHDHLAEGGGPVTPNLTSRRLRLGAEGRRRGALRGVPAVPLPFARRRRARCAGSSGCSCRPASPGPRRPSACQTECLLEAGENVKLALHRFLHVQSRTVEPSEVLIVDGIEHRAFDEAVEVAHDIEVQISDVHSATES